MSSTARGTIRNANDYYVTPQWLVQEFLEQFIADYSIDVNCHVLDPSAGGCEKHEATYPNVLRKMGFNRLSSFDIRTDAKAEFNNVDYLNLELGPIFGLIITNPPFDKSTEFTERALTQTTPNGHVVMLQRLNWLGSKKRKPFWDDAPLKQIYVHHKRASFYPELPNKKDSIEYAHFVFQKGYSGAVALSII